MDETAPAKLSRRQWVKGTTQQIYLVAGGPELPDSIMSPLAVFERVRPSMELVILLGESRQ